MTAHAPRRARLAWAAVAAAAIAAGAFLRLWQLGAQFLLDDEWHAINKLLQADFANIATHFGLADYSIPLTLYFRFLYLHGGLSEWGMRLPMLLAGVGLLFVPWLCRLPIAPRARALWTGLMALSPMMINHARTARPYAITTLLCLVAVLAFREWQEDGARRWRWAALYVAVTFLAGWLHLIALSFALTPFLFYGVRALAGAFGRERRADSLRALRDLVALGALTLAPLACALLPPLATDAAALAAKTGNGTLTAASLYRALSILFGIASPWLLGVFALACALGLRAVWQRERTLAAYLASVVLVAALAIAASHAAYLEHAPNFARYLQPAVPILLLFAAQGAAAALERLRAPLPQAAAAALALAGLYVAGPLPSLLYRPNQFMGDAYFQFDYDPAHNPYLTTLPHGPIPAFYRELGRRAPASLTLIETPWSLETDSDPQPLYQAVHRQWIKVALTTPECGVADYGNYPESETGMRLRQFVHLSALLRGETRGADYLVVHLRSWPKPDRPPPQWPDVNVCLPSIERRFGPAVYRDEDIVAFALATVGREP